MTASEECLDYLLVFFRFSGASRVNQKSPGAHHLRHRCQDLLLSGPKKSQLIRVEPPFDFGVSAQGPQTGAGDISQYRIEFLAKRGRRSGISHENVKTGSVASVQDGAQASCSSQMDIRRSDASLR